MPLTDATLPIMNISPLVLTFAAQSMTVPLASLFHWPVIGALEPWMISIAIPGMVFLFIAVIVGFGLWHSTETEKARQATIRLALEKGLPLPPDLLKRQPVPPELLKELLKAGPPKADLKGNDRRFGLINVALGIGLFVALRAMPYQTGGAEWFALIPFLIGVALLVNWALTKNPGNGDPKA